jgi:hypothetical protein
VVDWRDRVENGLQSDHSDGVESGNSVISGYLGIGEFVERILRGGYTSAAATSSEKGKSLRRACSG